MPTVVKSGRLHGALARGLTTKVHVLVDAYGLPIALKLTAGEALDGRCATDMFNAMSKDDVLLADRL